MTATWLGVIGTIVSRRAFKVEKEWKGVDCYLGLKVKEVGVTKAWDHLRVVWYPPN